MLPNWYEEYKKIIEENIILYSQEFFLREENRALIEFAEKIQYSLEWWKKIRSILALEFYIHFSWNSLDTIQSSSDIMKLCVAIEMLHAYSLVHDDLPCMDNDEYRRGNLTTWKKYSQADAVLVGDLLNSLSFEILSELEDKEVWMIILQMFGNSVGIGGMLGGQVLDLYYENNPDKLTLKTLEETHNKKTGRLIWFSILAWIMLSWNVDQVSRFANFWKNLWLAFQVKDDLLDVEGTFEETWKSVSFDTTDIEKKGFIYFMWIKDTKQYLNDILSECRKNISELKNEKINFIVDYIGTRKK